MKTYLFVCLVKNVYHIDAVDTYSSDIFCSEVMLSLCKEGVYEYTETIVSSEY